MKNTRHLFRSLLSLSLLTSILLLVSCEEKIDQNKLDLEAYNKTYDTLTNNYLEQVKAKYEAMEQTPKLFAENPVRKELDLENKITLEFGGVYADSPFNTVLLAGEFYGYEEEPKFPIVNQTYLKTLRKWVNGDSLDFGGDNIRYKKTQIENFKTYCDHFLDAKYVVVVDREKVELPHYVWLEKETEYGNDIEFHPAFEIGKIGVLQIEGNQGMAYLSFKAEMPDNISFQKGQDLNKFLMNKFFKASSEAKKKELSKLFNVKGSFPKQILAPGAELDLEVK